MRSQGKRSAKEEPCLPKGELRKEGRKKGTCYDNPISFYAAFTFKMYFPMSALNSCFVLRGKMFSGQRLEKKT